MINLIKNLFKKKCYCPCKQNAWVRFEYHTHYKNNASDYFDAVMLRCRKKCMACGKIEFTGITLPPALTKLVFDNWDEILKDDDYNIQQRDLREFIPQPPIKE